MKWGLVAFATRTGLGYQTRAIFRNLNPDRTMVIDLSKQKSLPFEDEWFPGGMKVTGSPTDEQCREFMDCLDVVFACETPMNYGMFRIAREMGVRTVLQYNYEFLDYWSRPQLPKPTVFAAPSMWMVEHVKQIGVPVYYLPVPVDRDGLPERDVTEARTFFHIGGRAAVADRNGTQLFITVAQDCRDLCAEWVLYTQTPIDGYTRRIAQRAGVTVVDEVPSRRDLYGCGDVLVLPRRYGGLCLPLNEAVGCGIPVLMPEIDPQVRWMHPWWMVPAVASGVVQAKCNIRLYDVDRCGLADRVRLLHGSPGVVSAMAQVARGYGVSMSWDVLRPAYWRVMDAVMGMRA